MQSLPVKAAGCLLRLQGVPKGAPVHQYCNGAATFVCPTRYQNGARKWLSTLPASDMKGVPEERLRTEITTVLRRTALPLEMAERPAGQYSGGSKRKLALGIALVGGSRTILLDEPSSGMVSCIPCKILSSFLEGITYLSQ